MSEDTSRGSRTGLLAGLAIALVVVGWTVTAPGLEVGEAAIELGDIAVDDTAYVGAAAADTSARLLQFWADTVGPIEVAPVLCPGEALGSSRTCQGGPLTAYDVELPAMGEDDDAASILVLEVTRTGPEPAAVCGLRVAYANGSRIGIDAGDLRILLQPEDELAPLCG